MEGVVYGTKYHIANGYVSIFIPKYGREIVYYQLSADIQKIIKDLCKWKGIEIVGLNTVTIKKYMREYEKEDQIMDKLKTKEYVNLFKGSK